MKKQISEREVELIVGNTVSSLAFEGLTTTPEEIEELKEAVRGNIPWNEYKKKILGECKDYAG